ncbi:DNA/RNA helicase, DEAD/DEAH box type, N-terminal [Cynara cardunculus var. scolymus]|uniref:ATP-dependent RNA helicase n=1 Tax=Cynara cardunculus var. scolymus TaxID=59895 RepID=A0A103XE61_CYNCS|nr:DNA/RNA helicase, DEAD/DEAH box type, N-terminal [Cynara cardunculus var. scolymus]
MPVNLFSLPQFHLPNSSSLPVTLITMQTNSSLSRIGPVFTRAFPDRLSSQSLSSSDNLGFPKLMTTVQPGLHISTSISKHGSEIRAAKGLIEDEAELSGWFKKSQYSESDDGGDDWRSSDRGGRGGSAVKRRSDDYNGGYGNRERGGGGRGSFGGSSRGGGSRGSFGGSSRGGGNRDTFGGNSRGGGNRGSFGGSSRGGGNRGSFGGSSRGRGRFGGEFGSRSEGSVSRGENRFENGRGGGRGSSNLAGRGRGRGRFGGEIGRRNDGFSRDSNREDGNWGSYFDSFPKEKERYGRDTEREDDRFVSNRRDDRFGGSGRGGGRLGGELGRRNDSFSRDSNRGNGNWGSFDSFPKEKERYVRDPERENDRFMLNRRDDRFGGSGGGSGGGGGVRTGVKSMGTGSLMMSDEEDVDDEEGEKILMHNYKELISDEEDNDEYEDDEEDDDGVLGKGLSLSGLDIEDGATSSPRVSADGNESYLSETRFDQCSVSPSSLKAIKDAGYEKMTIVQEATLPVILKGKDVLAKARTGTGKTVAFLLPAIEVVVNLPPVGRDERWPPIVVLIICPTRELASQAAMEANKLLKYHPSVGVQVVIGGTRLATEQRRIQANPCQILVATPGRLKDHIMNTSGFANRINGVKVLVLDEADHLLDMGFRKDIENIIAAVPKQRQTLLFSATVPPEVRQICHIALKRDHEYINTVEEGSEETHTQVQQKHLVAPLEKQFSLLYTLLKDHIVDDPDYKVLVFCTTAMVTKLVADLLGQLKLNVREIHSRKSQSYRTQVSDEFRKSKGLILVTSDVSARGVDYPDVTLVIQEGQGILLLAPWEQFFLSTLADLPISKAELPLIDPDTKKKVERALSYVDMKNKESAYQAWLGYYNSNKTVGKDKQRLVELANEFSRSMGLDIPPSISRLVLGKMGLKNVPGLRSK